MVTQKTISIGNTVHVVMANGKSLAVTIKSPQEASPAELIVSYESPIGKALLSKCEGDPFSYTVEGRLITGTITKVL
jgi:transcription elongation GreA/GreB family factor